jgi:hypothetical protein
MRRINQRIIAGGPIRDHPTPWARNQNFFGYAPIIHRSGDMGPITDRKAALSRRDGQRKQALGVQRHIAADGAHGAQNGQCAAIHDDFNSAGIAGRQF